MLKQTVIVCVAASVPSSFLLRQSLSHFSCFSSSSFFSIITALFHFTHLNSSTNFS